MTLLAAGLLLGTVGVVGWSVSSVKPSQLAPGETVSPVTPSTDGRQQMFQASDADLSMALRRPLTDPPPPRPRPTPRVVQPAPSPTPSLELTLVGTIMDSESSLAIIADATGDFDVKGVGESLELNPPGVSVKSIQSEQVELQYRGETSTVKLDRDAKRRPKRDKKKDKPRRPVR